MGNLKVNPMILFGKLLKQKDEIVPIPEDDHGDLNGLGDDDHAQYLLANGTRACTGEQRFEVGIEIGKFDNVSGGITFNISGSNFRQFFWNNDTRDFRLDDGLRIVQLSGSSGPELDFVDDSGNIWTIVKDDTTGSFMIRDDTNDRHILVCDSGADMIVGTSTVSGASILMNTGILDVGERPYAGETPPSGRGRLYVVNGELFFKNDAGTETKLA